MKAFSLRERSAAKHWSIRLGIRGNFWRRGNVERPTPTVQRRMEETTTERRSTLTINEIYHSIQGESTWAGEPCVFVRLTFCDLRCTYCDTEYAFYEGKKQTLNEIVAAVGEFRCPLVEITGGEPLLQKNVLPLITMLADAGHTVLLETSGAH